jgi:hypothetical protein
MRMRAACLLFATALFLPANAMAECTEFSERHWGCGTLFCAIVDAMTIPVALVPKYQLAVGDGHVRNGLGWEYIVSIIPNPGDCFRWQQDLSVEFVWYPWITPSSTDSSYKGQMTWRTWIPANLVGGKGWGLRLGGGAGGHVGLGGAGPRVESRLWIGEIEEGVRIFGFFISAAYEPDLVNTRHRAAFAAGLELPLLI